MNPDFDTKVAQYYDRVIEKGYHNQEKYISNILKIVKKGDTVLELGSGTGKLLIPLLEQGIKIEGLDASNSMNEILKSKNKKAIVHLSSLQDFKASKKFDYIVSCNGPLSIKGEELESYIIDKKEMIQIMKKYLAMSKKGLLINKGLEKPSLKIALNDEETFVHKEVREQDYIIMINLLFKNNELNDEKIFLKRRFSVSEIFPDAGIKDYNSFFLIKN